MERAHLLEDGSQVSAESAAPPETAPASATAAPKPEAANAASALPPEIAIASHRNLWLQVGNASDAYLITDDRWGAAGLTEGVSSGQYEQYVGRSPQAGPNGEVAFRTKWRWPQGTTEVKGFPSIVYGAKPGHFSNSNLISGHPVQLPDGSNSQVAPAGRTAGTVLPLQLPLQSLKAKLDFRHNSEPTGEGQLTFDIWLQSDANQGSGFTGSSITHEIMIPLANWGGYGSHKGGRNPGWFDHTATIAGKQYHIYVTKGSDQCLRYNFSSLNGSHGRTGWKMIAFVPAVLPVEPGEIDLAAIINYVSTRTDACGSKWAVGNEYVTSVELGVEPVVGTGDITVFNYKVSK
ncbi:hypothetical protein JI739_02325 [Ramlibacter sp. AW1]|uniref:Uncharacterized protein n=1 Tax=Ramlibacter aurantiacus TaxID=2801330 RepID=A0A936ZF73_9BURK|nr:hypothetical protein [Ramlibacter aurantiacus]MBL0419173.1 hypothetical protein [Ramlibacter aurantiacus]